MVEPHVVLDPLRVTESELHVGNGGWKTGDEIFNGNPDHRFQQRRHRRSAGSLHQPLAEDRPLLSAVFTLEIRWRGDRQKHLGGLQRLHDGVIPLFAELDVLLVKEPDFGVFWEAPDVANALRQVVKKLFEKGVVIGAGVTQKEVVRHLYPPDSASISLWQGQWILA